MPTTSLSCADVTSLSLAVIPVETYSGEQLLGRATAFVERGPHGLYVVTNWHTVTGRHPATGRPKADDCITPLKVRAIFAGRITIDGLAGITLERRYYIDIDVTWGSHSEWVMHQQGQDVDLAAAKLPDNVGADVVLQAISDSLPKGLPSVKIASDVFILGFPKGLQPTGMLPLWKRGSIATEPSILPQGEPCFWIDAATRDGMSGSPVVIRTVQAGAEDRLITRGYTGPDALFAVEPGLFLLGVYSGRMGVEDALEAQLGKVWRRDLVEEMLTNPRPLEYEERPSAPVRPPKRQMIEQPTAAPSNHEDQHV